MLTILATVTVKMLQRSKGGKGRKGKGKVMVWEGRRMGGDGRGGDGRGGDGRREGGEGQGWEVREGKERARAATPSKYQQRNNRESKLEGKNNSPQEPWRVKSSVLVKPRIHTATRNLPQRQKRLSFTEHARPWNRSGYKSGRSGPRAFSVVFSRDPSSEMLPKFAAAAVLLGLLAPLGNPANGATEHVVKFCSPRAHMHGCILHCIRVFSRVYFVCMISPFPVSSQECFTSTNCTGSTIAASSPRECCAGTVTGMSYGVDIGDCEVRGCIGELVSL